MKNLIIFGSSYHAKVVFWEVMKTKRYDVLGFVDDKIRQKKIIIKFKRNNYINLGSTQQAVLSLIKQRKKFCGIIGIGSNIIRKKIVKEIGLLDKSFKWEKIVSKSADIDFDVFIDKGSFINSGVVIKNGTKIKKHCLINTSASIDHDNYFDDFSSCGPGVITGGNVKVGQLSHLGIGSVIKEKIEIEKDVFIGGNSFVNKDCKRGNIYFGVPIKKQ